MDIENPMASFSILKTLGFLVLPEIMSFIVVLGTPDLLDNS